MLVLFMGGMLVSFPHLPAILAGSQILAALFVLQTFAKLAALCIVFLTSARRSFGRSSESPNKTLQPTREDARV